MKTETQLRDDIANRYYAARAEWGEVALAAAQAQKELIFPSEPFALVPESTLDGEALAQVAKQRKLDREASEAKQTDLATDPETALREMYTRQGVSKARQDEIIRDATAKAQPGAMVGPFEIPR